MSDLLQRLWNEFSKVTDGVSEVIGVYPLDKDSLERITDDTDEMAKLRQDLFDAGVQNICGFDYSTKK